MQTMNAPDLRVAEAIGRLSALIVEGQRTAGIALRDSALDLEQGQPPNVHRYELAMRAHYLRHFAKTAHDRIENVSHAPNLVAIVKRAAVDYLEQHSSQGSDGLQMSALRYALNRVIFEVEAAVQA